LKLDVDLLRWTNCQQTNGVEHQREPSHSQRLRAATIVTKYNLAILTGRRYIFRPASSKPTLTFVALPPVKASIFG
jgi:hypothetical protein